MSDPIDEIVERAMEHMLVLQVGVDPAQPELTVTVAGVVFARCSEGCSVSAGVMAMETGDTILNVYEAETRHRLYVAITGALERHVRPAPSHRTVMPAFRAGDPCPICGAAMVQRQGGVECISDHK